MYIAMCIKYLSLCKCFVTAGGGGGMAGWQGKEMRRALKRILKII